MSKFTKILMSSALGFAGAMSLGSPAVAQVNGIATANPARAIAASQARSTAYQQISTTYSAQATALSTARQQASALQQQLDTNKDGQVSDAEVAAAQAAKNPVIQQIQAKQTEIETAQEPIARAQLYALEQILLQYEAAQKQVVSDKKISLILTPDALMYAPESVDITQDIINALNTRVPAVSASAPADWQPNRQTVALHQQVQELLIYSALVQQQRAQQAGQTAPAAPLPEGR